ncbi:lytic transglycosylase domain-containing protein [Pilimelia columellifera]|uniref:Transglycosylase SLT domain-containing protein n=1 Tax=Pilimelia columellifera subsp. columellifera TaxID=706583 RepID=A0ABP6AR76_9ACTN
MPGTGATLDADNRDADDPQIPDLPAVVRLRSGVPRPDQLAPPVASRHRQERPKRRLLGVLRRPGVRHASPYLVMIALTTVAVLAGGVIIPSAAGPQPSRSGAGAGGPAPASAVPGPTLPDLPGAGPGAPAAGGRPADSLRDWATPLGARLQIPTTALEAYAYAELVLARTKPGCRLSWTTLAAIGKVESSHGGFGGARLNIDGAVQPPIIGPPLDGTNNNKAIRDTDRGALDNDTTWDRAVGPMQFLPSTWSVSGVDADGDAKRDPNDLDDAALAAGGYLCGAGQDLSNADQWWQAVLRYNNLTSYAQQVHDAANEYGRLSRG